VADAGVVVAPTDGSPWLQGRIDAHRPDPVCVRDFSHATEHLTRAAAATFGAGDGSAAAWAAAQIRSPRNKMARTQYRRLIVNFSAHC
jgi:hypothetical protein